MRERAALIQSLKIVLFAGTAKPFPPLDSIRDELQKTIVRELIDSLMRNADWLTEFGSLVGDSERERVYAFLQIEQINILEILFSLALD
jgi:hypothetical protein